MKTVLVTGGNRGIGRALAEEFARRGWHVAITAREPGQIEPFPKGVDIAVEQLNVSDEASIDALQRRWSGKPLDMLVNNAGVYFRTPPLSAFDVAEWQTTMETNLFGPMRLSLALLDSLRRSQTRRIVSITSALGSITGTFGGFYAYRSSKAALNMAMRSLAVDLAAEQFTIVQISPGLVATDMTTAVPGEKISPSQSARAMADILEPLDHSHNGRFFSHFGTELSW